MLAPSEDERMWWAFTVEGYQCPNCSTTLRFPRYNHPEKLLDSRTGKLPKVKETFSINIC